MKTLAQLLTLTFAFSANAASIQTGGVISGQPVTFRTLVKCQARSIDVTHPVPEATLEVIQEDSLPKTSADLRILTRDHKGKALRYYLARGKVKLPNKTVIMTYQQIGSTSQYEKTGEVHLARMTRGFGGMLRPVDTAANDVPELLLGNCLVSPDASL